jgi:hypothetical protein
MAVLMQLGPVTGPMERLRAAIRTRLAAVPLVELPLEMAGFRVVRAITVQSLLRGREHDPKGGTEQQSG